VLGVVDTLGGIAVTRNILVWCAELPGALAPLATGFVTALASNLINNLPVGLNVGETLPAVHAASAPAALIGINLGPNASIGGSLATLLWLRIVRRGGIVLAPFTFVRAGILSVVPSLVAALLAV